MKNGETIDWKSEDIWAICYMLLSYTYIYIIYTMYILRCNNLFDFLAFSTLLWCGVEQKVRESFNKQSKRTQRWMVWNLHIFESFPYCIQNTRSMTLIFFLLPTLLSFQMNIVQYGFNTFFINRKIQTPKLEIVVKCTFSTCVSTLIWWNRNIYTKSDFNSSNKCIQWNLKRIRSF